MLYRTFTRHLETWYNTTPKRALLIDGARQIGKTTLIREFAKTHYGKNFAEINFITTPSAKEIFEGDLSADEIIARLTLFLKQKLIPGKTLIFFDEIQECAQIRTAIKFLVDDGRFDYIESGSLLGINYGEITSYAVGYEDIQTMYPMDFEEFALASGVSEETFALLKKSYDTEKPVDPCIHEQMLKLFTYYIIIGGMPACVQEYVKSRDMARVSEIQTSILKLYKKDITKYAGSDAAKVTRIFDAMPAELNNKNKRFMLSDLAKTARIERYESCFNWLSDAGVALPCWNLTEVKEPVEINLKRSLFKFYLCDTGLLCAMCGGDTQYKIVNGALEINEGSILENLFAQSLQAAGFALYYYDRKSIGEVDFVVQQKGTLLPVEIKSGKDYTKHNALNNLLEVEEFKLDNAIVFCIGNVCRDGKILYLPLYMSMFFKRETMLDKIRLDFSLPAV